MGGDRHFRAPEKSAPNGPAAPSSLPAAKGGGAAGGIGKAVDRDFREVNVFILVIVMRLIITCNQKIRRRTANEEASLSTEKGPGSGEPASEVPGRTAMLWLGAAIGRSFLHTFGRTSMDLGMSGKVALVTGGSIGIGKGIARSLGREGCKVAIVARDAARLQAAAEEIQGETGSEIVAFPGDLMHKADADRVVAQTAEHFGRIDILVNNAGAARAG